MAHPIHRWGLLDGDVLNYEYITVACIRCLAACVYVVSVNARIHSVRVYHHNRNVLLLVYFGVANTHQNEIESSGVLIVMCASHLNEKHRIVQFGKRARVCLSFTVAAEAAIENVYISAMWIYLHSQLATLAGFCEHFDFVKLPRWQTL